MAKRVSCAKKTSGPILTICTLCDMFLYEELHFERHDHYISVKIFSGVNFLVMINSLPR